MSSLLSRLNAKDLGLATVLGATVAVSPFTPDDLLPSLLAGVVVGVGVLAWRAWHRPTAGTEAPSVPLSTVLPPRVVAVLLLWAAIFAPAMVWLYGRWTASIWINSHGIFIPLLCGYLAWTALREDPVDGERASAWGFAFLLPGLALVVLDAGIGSHYVAILGLLLTLPGLSLLLLGAERTRALAVPLTASLLMFPVPNVAASHLVLRRITAEGVHPLLHELGVAAYRENTVIYTAKNAFVVADACSGFSTLYAAVATAIILACYCTSHWRRVAVVLAAVPLALGANVARVLLLVLITDWAGPSILETPIHEASGVATFVVVLVGLFLIADRKAIGERLA